MELLAMESNLTKALEDLGEIRKAIANVQQLTSRSANALRLEFVIHAVLTVLAGGFLIVESTSEISFTRVLYWSDGNHVLRWVIVAGVAAILVALCSALYVALWRGARRTGESFNDYVSRNFSPLRRASFLSDLFIKFMVVALMILVQRPDNVAPLLLLFTGDYILQGRLFVLPPKIGLAVGILCLGLGTYQVLFMDGSLEVPFAAFLLASVLSLFKIRNQLKALSVGSPV